jgi:hypothetical protein
MYAPWAAAARNIRKNSRQTLFNISRMNHLRTEDDEGKRSRLNEYNRIIK